MLPLFKEVISLAATNKTKLQCLKDLPHSKDSIISFEDTPRIVEEFRENGYRCVAIVNEFNKDKFINDKHSINTMNI